MKTQRLTSCGYGSSFIESKLESERLILAALGDTAYKVVETTSTQDGDDYWYVMVAEFQE